MKLRSKTVKMLVGLLVSALFLGLAFHKVSFAGFWAALGQVSLSALTFSVLFFGLSCVFRALMWRVTTKAFGKVSFDKLFGGVVVGYLANNFLPLRAGEVVRAGYLSAASGIPVATSLSTIFIERAFDVFSLSLLLLLAVCTGIKGFEQSAGKKVGFFLGALALLLILFVGVIKVGKGVEGQKMTPRSLGILLRYVREFIQPLGQLRKPQVIALLAVLSLGAWISNYFSVLVLLIKSRGEGLPQAALLVLLFVNLGMLIPSSPGALGVMQAAFWLALAPFGMAKDQSLALSFAYQGGLYFFSVIVGLPFLLTCRVKLAPGEKREGKPKWQLFL